jgi:hypothetical protein
VLEAGSNSCKGFIGFSWSGWSLKLIMLRIEKMTDRLVVST